MIGRSIASLSIAIALVVPAAVAEDVSGNWPAFRGPDARGVAEGENLPTHWSSTENVEWKTDLPGRGWSSPVVWGNTVFLTTAIAQGELEDPKKGLYGDGNRRTQDIVLERMVYALALDSGEVLWYKKLHEGKPEFGIHIKNSFASETPVTDGELLYTYFGNVGIFALDFEGNVVWEKAFEPHKMRYGWGTAASPVLHEGRLYIVNDNDQESFLVALEAKTGEEIWRTERDGEKSNWSTPYIWETDGRTEIVTPGTRSVRSYDLDGKLLWSFKGMSSITIATPYADGDLLYISSGYVGDKLRPVYAIRPGAKGDITLAEGATSNEFIAWSDPEAGPYNPSTIVYDGRLYVLYDRAGFACYDAKDGREIYGRERIPKSRGFTSSPWAYKGYIFCLNENGDTFAIKAGDSFEVSHVNSLSDDDMGMATPAIAGDRLLIRTGARIYSIRNKG